MKSIHTHGEKKNLRTQGPLPAIHVQFATATMAQGLMLALYSPTFGDKAVL